MLTGAALAFIPGAVLWVLPAIVSAPQSALLVFYVITIAIAMLPFFYIYALYKHRLGEMEFRANRLLSLFAFLVIYTTLFITAYLVLGRIWNVPADTVPYALAMTTIFLLGGLFTRAPFQKLIDRLAYGTEHNPDDILRAFVSEIPRALNDESLIKLLTQEVEPSLLIRQSALYRRTQDGHFSLVYERGGDTQLPEPLDDSLQQLLKDAGRYRPPEPPEIDPYTWVRLVIPTRVQDETIGVWLLGRRDPEDFYPKPDVDLLLTLGGQVAVALETIRLIDDLRQRMDDLDRAYRELQELDRLKDEFIQNVSHELRTPLTFVRGYTELFLEDAMGPLTEDQRQAIEVMAYRTDEVIRLVNNILAFQKMAVEEARREPVDVVALAREALHTAEIIEAQNRHSHAKHEFVLDAPDEVPPVLGDKEHLMQALDNLLSNAVKFSPEGGQITVRIRPVQHRFIWPGCEPQILPAVQISVSDQGVGIPADQIDRIWQRFYQVDGSSTRRFGGVGLGLAIVR